MLQLVYAVAQLVQALHYKLEGRGFDFRWCHCNFSLTQSFRPLYGPGIDSASNRNECQEYFLGGKGGHCLGLTNLQPSYAQRLEIWDPQTPGNLRACVSNLTGDMLTLTVVGLVEISTGSCQVALSG